MAKAVTSPIATGLSGKAGNVVFARTRSGVVVRPRSAPRDARTPAQMASRARMARVVQAWRELTRAQAAQWHAYAAQQVRTDLTTGTAWRPTGLAVFNALSLKFAQANPAAPIPTTPPARPFLGDALTVAAQAAPGGVRFTASGPSTPGVLVELLLQPLRFAHQSPKARGFRSQALVAFTEGALEAFVAAPPGWTMPACRFVCAATGQDTELARLEAVEVGKG